MRLSSLNNGKPLAEAAVDMDDVAAAFDYYADLAQGLDYVADRESALYSRDALEMTIATLGRSNVTRMDLIAHSMGGFLLMDTLRLMARTDNDAVFRKLNAVVLISPDIEIDVFRKEAEPVSRAA